MKIEELFSHVFTLDMNFEETGDDVVFKGRAVEVSKVMINLKDSNTGRIFEIIRANQYESEDIPIWLCSEILTVDSWKEATEKNDELSGLETFKGLPVVESSEMYVVPDDEIETLFTLIDMYKTFTGNEVELYQEEIGEYFGDSEEGNDNVVEFTKASLNIHARSTIHSFLHLK